jgi:hypothetical protein
MNRKDLCFHRLGVFSSSLLQDKVYIIWCVAASVLLEAPAGAQLDEATILTVFTTGPVTRVVSRDRGERIHNKNAIIQGAMLLGAACHYSLNQMPEYPRSCTSNGVDCFARNFSKCLVSRPSHCARQCLCRIRGKPQKCISSFQGGKQEVLFTWHWRAPEAHFGV